MSVKVSQRRLRRRQQVDVQQLIARCRFGEASVDDWRALEMWIRQRDRRKRPDRRRS